MHGKYLFTKSKRKRAYAQQLPENKSDVYHLVVDADGNVHKMTDDEYQRKIIKENEKFAKDYPELYKRAVIRSIELTSDNRDVNQLVAAQRPRTFKTQLGIPPYKFRVGSNGKGYYERYVLSYVDKNEFGEPLYLIRDLQIREAQDKLTAEDLSRYFGTKFNRNVFKSKQAEELAEDLNKAYSEKYVP